MDIIEIKTVMTISPENRVNDLLRKGWRLLYVGSEDETTPQGVMRKTTFTLGHASDSPPS